VVGAIILTSIVYRFVALMVSVTDNIKQIRIAMQLQRCYMVSRICNMKYVIIAIKYFKY